MTWPDIVSILSTAAPTIGAIGGALGIILTILKIKEYWAGRPKTIATHLAPKLRELRRMLLEVTGNLSALKAQEAFEYWRQEFVLRGHLNDLTRMGSDGTRIMNDMDFIGLVFKHPPDQMAVQMRALLSYLSGEDPKTFAAGITDPSKTKVWQDFVRDAIAGIDGLLEKAEGT